MAGGGDVPMPRAHAAARGGRGENLAPSLPLDVVLEIAARSDPATLVRCAATCRDARRRAAADPGFGRRLRLRHADCFVPSLLSGHLELLQKGYSYSSGLELRMVDIAESDTAASQLTAGAAEGFFHRTPDGKTAGRPKLVASRDGLLLVRTTDLQRRGGREELRVCDPATGRSQTLPPEPTFPGAAQNCWEPYVLLVGDGEAGGIRPFQVLKANLVMSEHKRYLETQTFSSENGAWGRYTEIGTPYLHGTTLFRGGRPMIAGGAVHWLCFTNSGCHVLKLHIRTAQVTVTTLPVSFRQPYHGMGYLLATSTPVGGELVVLVADNEKIYAWVQTNPMAEWKQRPLVVTGNKTMLQFRNKGWLGHFHVVQLRWFAERSGLVFFTSYISSNGYRCLLLDIRSMEIVRCVKDGILYKSGCCWPYEMDLSSWAPTFSSAI